MIPLTPAARFDEVQTIDEMVNLVEKFLAGAATRAELLAWSRAVQQNGKQAQFHNYVADDLHTCLHGLDQQRKNSAEPLIRRSDLAAHLLELRRGIRQIAAEPVAVVKLSLAEIARRTGTEEVRFPWNGLGWFEKVRFVSRGTGTAFLAIFPIDEPIQRRPGPAIHAYQVPQSAAERSYILADLFDVLGIDDGEATGLWAPLTCHWDLMRQDDNGNKFLVASFTGYAKARGRMAQLDATQHKQLYWLEERKSAASS